MSYQIKNEVASESIKMVKFDRFILQEKDFRNASNQKKKDKKFPYKSSHFRKKP